MELKPCVVSTVLGASNSGPSSTTLLISINGAPWQSFSMSTVAHTKMGHVSQTTPHKLFVEVADFNHTPLAFSAPVGGDFV